MGNDRGGSHWRFLLVNYWLETMPGLRVVPVPARRPPSGLLDGLIAVGLFGGFKAVRSSASG